MEQAYSDAELKDMMNTWFEHYQSNGERHYNDTNDEEFMEIYLDKVIDRVLGELNMELTEEEEEKFCDRLANL